MTGKIRKSYAHAQLVQRGSYIYTAIITCESVWVDVIEKTFGSG